MRSGNCTIQYDVVVSLNLWKMKMHHSLGTTCYLGMYKSNVVLPLMKLMNLTNSFAEKRKRTIDKAKFDSSDIPYEPTFLQDSGKK
jgi:hypothetical protein